MWAMKRRVVVGLPAFNEAAALPVLLEKLNLLRLDLNGSLAVIVVDDGSTDGTGDILAGYAGTHAFLRYVRYGANRGFGAALSTLLAEAIALYEDDDMLVTIDADNTHDPSIIPDLVGKMERENLDVVVASRFVRGGREIGLPFARKLYSRGASLFFRLFFPIREVTDYSSGFRCYRIGYLKKAASRFDGRLVTVSGFECNAELMARFSKCGVRAGEYPLVLQYDLKEGKSKMPAARTIFGYLRLLRTVK